MICSPRSPPALGWYTNRHFADSVGWPLALIAFGILMIALSAVAMRIDRRYIRAG